MHTSSEITSFSPGSGIRVPARSHLESSAERIDLAGQWRFSFSRDAAGAGESAPTPDFDDSSWDTIAVPAHWVLTGGGEYGAFGQYGAPAYQNVEFPFPVDVPNVPDDNPTGDYRTTFTLSAEHMQTVADGGRLYLRTLGIESLAIASVNGTEVGVVRGSRLTQELDITGAATEGENLLHVRVHQWSSNSYLEDQDQWWLPGIFRDVHVLVRPRAGIEDVWLRADFSPVNGHDQAGPGTLIPEIRASEAAFPVTVAVDELGVSETFNSPASVGPIAVGDVEPWSADSPRLYSATVSNAAETVSVRVGFRRVEIRGHEWQVNGKKLRIRGVNRHEYDPEMGRVWDREKARESLLLMKRHNINAVRTSHYPPHPEFFDLTDELGFWVMDECDYEAHGFETGGWVDVPANDPRWREALLDRVERFVERDKNHPSIVSWSLGNEGHTGANMAAMAEWIRTRDPERPVHYEPDFDGRYTDLVSRMYPPVEHMEQMADGEGQGLATTPGRNAVLAQRPMVLCEYVHAMGNGPGGLLEYERVFETRPQWHGGFVWEWRDHGILARTPDGDEFYGYGGDFGEVTHDGSFVCDGLVLSSGAPTPGLAEVGAVFSPISATVRCEGGFSAELADGDVHLDGEHSVWLTDRRHAGAFADVRVLVLDEADGEEIACHELELDEIDNPYFSDRNAEAILPPLELPDGVDASEVEVFRTIVIEQREATEWADAGHEIARSQVRVVSPRTGGAAFGRGFSLGAGATGTEGPSLEDAGAVFDPATGDLVSLRDLEMSGPRLTLFRAPTENDSLTTHGSYILADPALTLGEGVQGPSTAELWRAAGLDRMQRRVIDVEVSETSVRAVHRYAAAASHDYVDLEVAWSVDGETGEARLRAHAAPSSGWRTPWARLGLEFVAPLGATDASWFGTGPGESYPDSAQAATVGRYSSLVADLVTEYTVPQESGYRPGLRELAIEGLGLTVRTEPVGPHAERPGFQIREHSVAQVAAAAHQHELPEPAATHLIFDLAQHGLGTRSCGPDTLPKYQLRARSGTWSLAFGVEK